MTTPEKRTTYRAGLLNRITEIENIRMGGCGSSEFLGKAKCLDLEFQLAILDEYEALIKATTVKKRLNRMLEITED